VFKKQRMIGGVMLLAGQHEFYLASACNFSNYETILLS